MSRWERERDRVKRVFVELFFVMFLCFLFLSCFCFCCFLLFFIKWIEWGGFFVVLWILWCCDFGEVVVIGVFGLLDYVLWLVLVLFYMDYDLVLRCWDWFLDVVWRFCFCWRVWCEGWCGVWCGDVVMRDWCVRGFGRVVVRVIWDCIEIGCLWECVVLWYFWWRYCLCKIVGWVECRYDGCEVEGDIFEYVMLREELEVLVFLRICGMGLVFDVKFCWRFLF